MMSDINQSLIYKYKYIQFKLYDKMQNKVNVKIIK